MEPSAKLANILLILSLVVVAVVAVITINVDHPMYLLDNRSRAMYVDEGFYADAAQNFAHFGLWNMHLDSRHWPGAPTVAFLQTIVFSLFGSNLDNARYISIFLSLVSIAAFYLICRSRFTPLISLSLSLATLITINYVGFSRSAIGDPIATSLSMLALLIFVKVRLKEIAIPLSLILAFLAFFSKLYFLFAPATLAFLWGAELLVLPLFLRTGFQSRSIYIYLITISGLVLSYWLYQRVFIDDIANFMTINSNKKPVFDLTYLINTFDDAGEKMPFHTKSPTLLITLGLSTAYYLITRLWPSKFVQIWANIKALGRAEWAMGTFFVSGYLLVGVLANHKAHYHYFTILPVAFLAISSVNMIFKGHLKTTVIAILLVAHVAHQIPFYQQWFKRENLYAMDTSSKQIIDIIQSENTTGNPIPVLGEYSAQLALYGENIVSLDARWIPLAQFCDRLEYWKPKYYVAVVWPKSKENYGEITIKKCNDKIVYTNIVRYPLSKSKGDEIIFARIAYQ